MKAQPCPRSSDTDKQASRLAALKTALELANQQPGSTDAATLVAEARVLESYLDGTLPVDPRRPPNPSDRYSRNKQ